MNDTYINAYVRYLRDFMNIKKPIKIVFDCSNGAVGPILKKLFQNQPLITPHYINYKSDGTFPGHQPNPLIPGARVELQKQVLKRRADLGVIFDGDGDRVFFIDNRGRKIPAYFIAYLLFLDEKPPFVAEIFSFKSLEHLQLLRKKTFPSPVGTRFVKEIMKKRKATVGAEYSGHYFFKDFSYSDSAILAVAKVLDILSKVPYSLADFYDFLPKLYYEQFDIQNTNPKEFIKKIKTIYERKARRVGFIDGITFDFDDWFFMVRPSNTQSLVRFFVGSSDKLTFKREVKKLKSAASRH
ncbi:MAG: hypothetical protein KJI72_02255 [Patescibacteria group bacterium]|nr:hypothetical protein [Patescibacteria group bacterium]